MAVSDLESERQRYFYHQRAEFESGKDMLGDISLSLKERSLHEKEAPQPIRGGLGGKIPWSVHAMCDEQ